MINICAVSEFNEYHYLTCQMMYAKDIKEYQEAEDTIILFGRNYYKSSWDSEKGTITYRS